MLRDPLGVTQALRVDPPCYVRKVDRPGHWGSTEDGVEERLERAVGEIFEADETGGVSLYRVETALDLISVAVGLNSRRSSLTERLLLLAIADEEIAAVQLEKTRGDTLCDRANRRHYNAFFRDRFEVEQMLRCLIRTDRELGRISSGAMKKAIALARQDGCRAALPTSRTCKCDAEEEQ